MFEDLNIRSRIEDPESRAAGEIRKSKKKNRKIKKGKSTSIKLTTYNRIKTFFTVLIMGALLAGISLAFYYGVLIFLN